ncbi:MAG: NfeD family protein [Oscillospiraceae bacterium]|jgi:membrane protein implicated in regulation of membrane protease activity|nr:NfeD family protein [Oscillospiraceae bacterium]
MYELITWGVILIVAVIVELSTAQLVSVWFAAGALVAFLVSLLTNWGLAGQSVVFVLASGILLLLTRPLAKKFKPKFVPTNMELLVGDTAVITEEVDSERGTGRAKLSGTEWFVISESGEPIEPGTSVEIKAIDGIKLVVGVKHPAVNKR